MPTVDLIDVKGKKSGSIDLPEALFDATTNVPLIHQVVVAQLAAARQGTQSTLRRGEVSGTGKKPFKQKGTGRARQGSNIECFKHVRHLGNEDELKTERMDLQQAR